MSWEGKRAAPTSPWIKASRYMVIGCNVLSLIFGVILIVVALVILYDQNMIEVRRHLQLFTGYKAGLIVGVCLSSLVCLLSMVGFCVAWHHSARGLLIYSSLILFLIVGEMTVIILVLRYTSQEKMSRTLARVFQDVIYKMKINKSEATGFMNSVQRNLKCCGGFSFEDYTQEEMDLPWSCYYRESNVYLKGCGEMMIRYFNSNGVTVGLLAFLILFLQVILCICSWTEFFSKREIRRRIAASKV